MARVSTCLNFPRSTEEAFLFYRSVFGGSFNGHVARFCDMPPDSRPAGQPAMAEADRQLVMHVELPILGGHVLMGSDAPESMGFDVTSGSQVNINLEPDTREEADRLFQGLSSGGVVEMPMQDMFWGAYFGRFRDRYGVRWMVNCANPPAGGTP